MRRARIPAAFALVVGFSATAVAELDLGDHVLSGQIEVGYQAIAGDTDSAKFDEYRDARQWISRGLFLVENKDRDLYVRGGFLDSGQRDERYDLEVGRYGRWALWGSFAELPHNLSNNGLSPYSGVRDADLTLPFARPAPDLGEAVTGSNRRQSNGFRTTQADAGFKVRPSTNFEFETNYRLLNKQGTLFRGGLSSFFFSFADFATPIDERIHEVTADASWTGERWSATANYTGNRYDNRVGRSLTMDSPITDVDVVGQSSRWREALAPDNDAHSFTLAGSYALAAGFPLRITGSVGYSLRRQDTSFLAQTVNSTIAADPLLAISRGDLDGKVETLLGDLRVTARPTSNLNVDLKYRVYDFGNDSDVVSLFATVSGDRSISDDAPGVDRRSVPNEYRTQSASADASYRLHEDASVGFGWEWEHWDRSSGRSVTRTNEQGPNLRLDYRPASWAHLRASYSFRTRRRTGYNSFDYLEESFNPASLTAPGNDVFPELRKFPQADRRRHEANLIAQLLPSDSLDVTLNTGLDVSDYHESDFGLTDDQYWYIGGDVGWNPDPRVSLSAYYTFENGLLKQASRLRPVVGGVAVDDPSNDWSGRTREHAYYAGFRGSIELLAERLSVDLGYDFQRGTARTRSGGRSPDAVDWPTTSNSLHTLRAALTWRLDKHLSLKTEYRWERYQQRDFQLDDLPATAGNSILMSPEVGDYRAHIYGVSAIYDF